MIEGIAIMIAVYAGVRLLNEYILTGASLALARTLVAAAGLVGVLIAYAGIHDQASGVSNLLGGL